MLNEDMSKPCNLPQEVVMKEWPGNGGGSKMGRMTDLFAQASKQMGQDMSYVKADYKPTKF